MRGKLDVHCGHSVESPRDNGVRAKVRPYVVSATEELREALEDRIGLTLSLCEPARELLDCVQIALAEVVDVHEARSVECNEVAVLVCSVTICGFRIDAAAVHDLSDEGGFDIGRPGGQFFGELPTELGITRASRRPVVAAIEEVADENLDVGKWILGFLRFTLD